MSVLLISLCAVGVLISLYFTSVSFRWVRPDSHWIPVVCRMEEATCARIVFTPSAKVLGPPNSTVGLLFYALLGSAAATCGLSVPLIRLAGLGGSAVALLLSFYLTYSLLFVVRVKCVLCFAAHTINLIIFLLLLAQS